MPEEGKITATVDVRGALRIVGIPIDGDDTDVQDTLPTVGEGEEYPCRP